MKFKNLKYLLFSLNQRYIKSISKKIPHNNNNRERRKIIFPSLIKPYEIMYFEVKRLLLSQNQRKYLLFPQNQGVLSLFNGGDLNELR